MRIVIWCLLLALALRAQSQTARIQDTSTIFSKQYQTLSIDSSKGLTTSALITTSQSSVTSRPPFTDLIYGINSIQSDTVHNMCFNITDERPDSTSVNLTLTLCNNAAFIKINVVVIFVLETIEHLYAAAYDILPQKPASFEAVTQYSIPLSNLFTDPIDLTGLNLQAAFLLKGLLISPYTNHNTNHYFFVLPNDAKVVGDIDLTFSLKNCQSVQVDIVSLTVLLYPSPIIQQHLNLKGYRQVNILSRYVQTSSYLDYSNIIVQYSFYEVAFSGFTCNSSDSGIYYYPKIVLRPQVSPDSFLTINSQSQASNIYLQSVVTQILQFQSFSCPSHAPYIDGKTGLCTADCPQGYTYQASVKGCSKCNPHFCNVCSSNNICQQCKTMPYGMSLIMNNGSCECNTTYLFMTANNDSCDEICGDGYRLYLPCDDGNTKNNDGCSSVCSLEPGFNCLDINNKTNCSEVCGDGQRYILECDDGNKDNSDGCSDNCQIEDGWTCHDDALLTSKCSINTQTCGDGLRVNLPCDDGNLQNGDGCSKRCMIENGWICSDDSNNKSVCTQVCGDGLIFVLPCDDSNKKDNDGCSAACAIESGWTCNNSIGTSVCSQVCGDGILFVLPCDDGNKADGDGCSSTCKIEKDWTCNKVGNKSVCNQICGDGIVHVLPCDDGNTKNDDGCSSTCQIQPSWTCWSSNASNLTSKSKCSKKSSIKLTSYKKNPLANQLQLKFEGNIVKYKRRLLQTFDGSNYFKTNFPYTKMELTIPQTNKVELKVSYDQSLNGNTPLSLTYHSSTSSSMLTFQAIALPNVTNNNLALKVYPSEHYEAVEIFDKLTPPFTYVALFVLLISYLFVSKLLALESLFVLQFAYGGLVMLIKLEALMYPYRYLWIFNGYNYINEGTQVPDGRFSAVFYKTDFIDNFNIDFIIFFIFIAVGGVMLLINHYKPHRTLKIWGKNLVCEWQMSGMLFCAQQLMFSYIICMYYGERTGEGVAIGSVLLALYCAYAVWFARTKERGKTPYGDYRRFFKSYDKNFYSYVMIYRLLISLVMVVESQTIVSLSVLLALNIGWFALLVIRRPYIKEAELPPIINSLTLIALNIFYLVIRNNANQLFLDFSTYVPIAVLIIMGSILLFNTGYSAFRTVTYFRAKELAKKLAQQLTIQGNEKTDFSFETGDQGSEIPNQIIPSQLISETSENNRQDSQNVGIEQIEHVTPIKKITEQNNENSFSHDHEEYDRSQVIRNRAKHTPATDLRDRTAQ